jgi:hypothetical protein
MKKFMRVFLSHLFTAFVVYWASGIFIMKMAQYSAQSNWTFEQQLATSLSWPYVILESVQRGNP